MSAWTQASTRKSRHAKSAINADCSLTAFARSYAVKLAGARTSIIFVATKLQTRDKNNTCGSSHQKYKTRLLSRQKYAWHEKRFVATKYFSQQNFCRNRLRQIFVPTKICLSRQAYFCRGKGRVLSRKKLSPFLIRRMFLRELVLNWANFSSRT